MESCTDRRSSLIFKIRDDLSLRKVRYPGGSEIEIHDRRLNRRFYFATCELELLHRLQNGVTEVELEEILRSIGTSTSVDDYLGRLDYELLLQSHEEVNIDHCARTLLARESLDKLNSTIEYSRRNISYYADIFSSNPIRLQSVHDLANAVPILNREDFIRNFPERMVVPTERMRGDTMLVSTSGTTCERMVILHSREYLARIFHSTFWTEDPFQWSHAILAPPRCAGSQCTRRSLPIPISASDGYLLFDTTKITANDTTQSRSRITALRRAKTEVIVAEPYYLAETILRSNEIPFLPDLLRVYFSYVFCQRTTLHFLKNFLSCYVGIIFGMAEGGYQLMRTCSQGSLHLNEEYFIFEFEQQCWTNACRLLFTTIGRPLIPLIRYATSDLIYPTTDESRCPCGSPFQTIDRIAGRSADRISVGNRYHTIDAFDKIIGVIEGVAYYQVTRQAENGAFRFGGTANPTHVGKIVNQRLAEHFGFSLNISIFQLANIPLGNSGKFQLVIE